MSIRFYARRLALLATLLAGAWAPGASAQPNDAPYLVPGTGAYQLSNLWQQYQGPYDRRWFLERERAYVTEGVRGAGASRDLRIGQPIPRSIWSQEFEVTDWRGHGLFRAPRGYRWFQAGADYVLVDMRSGIIVQTRLNP
jgi:Ni/Co efflux regulator RcnB